jgi:glycogen(starch) synthase
MRNKHPKHPAIILSIILEWLAIQLAIAVTAPTKSMANYCKKTLNLFGTNIDVIPNAVEIDADLPKKHFCKPEKQILYVGRLERLKSPDFLSRVMSEILRDYPNVSLVFIGLDTPQGPKKSSMQVYCESLIGSDLRNRVKFLGKQPFDVVESYMTQSDLFVLPSRFESFGIAYVEAMIHQLPVIACKGSGVEDVVPNGLAGLFIDHDNDCALYDAIVLLLTDDQLREKMGEAGRRFALRHYDALEIAKAHEIYYRSILSGITASRD